MFESKNTLIVVYKDEMLMNQLRKLIESNDDKENGDIVGTKDDSVNVVSWEEKTWLANKKAGNINNKVLFLGDVKGSEKLIPVIDVEFDEFGVKYGWSGNQAIVFANIEEIPDRETYFKFLNKLKKLPIPNIIKKPKVSKSNRDNQNSETKILKNDKEGRLIVLKKTQDAILLVEDVIGNVCLNLVDFIADVFVDRKAVKRQMLFYGVIKLYNDGLEKFMNM